MHYDFRLYVFKKVAEKLSFTKAAKELFLSQPSVTNHIKELEKEVGEALFERLGNSIRLTNAGKLLYEYTLKIHSLYKEFDEKINVFKKSEYGEIKLGASTTVSHYILPKILSSFNRRFPKVTVSLQNGNSEQIEKLLVENKIHLGIIEGNSKLPQIKYEDFLRDEIVLVVSAKNKLLKPEITLNDLKDIPLVIRESGSGTLDIIYSELSKENFSSQELNIQMRLGSTEAIKEYLKLSDSASFLSVNAVQHELMRNELKIIDIKDFEITRIFKFITLIGNQSEMVNLFRKFALNELK